MRWPTTLFILLGAVIGVSTQTECTLYKLPDPKEGSSCEITIDWRSTDNKQATATCLEYFPTTFVTGTKEGDKTKCTVQAAYQCAGTSADSEVFLMFDKCYWFPKDTNGYIKNTIPEYQKIDPATKEKQICKGGKLSVFYSSTHAKFVGMKAHSLGIDKLWIGITANGRSIEEPDLMIHKQMWKLVDGDYWNGDELVKFDKTKDLPADASHYFMRTRTDYLNNRWQGSFERANGANVKATFACEFEAKFTANQRWYCDKLKDGLGLVAAYDGSNPQNPRCLYVSSSEYTFNGKAEDTAKGCMERPSDLHSGGMDDGTADPEIYKKLTTKGTLRIAGYKAARIGEEYDTSKWIVGKELQKKGSGRVTDSTTRRKLTQKCEYIDHHGKIQHATKSKIPWYEPDYPLNEDSDFPGESTTLGVKKGLKIDMPPLVYAPAICSIMFFQQCESNKINPCGKLDCTNENTYQSSHVNPIYHGFFTCSCPGDKLVKKYPDVPFKYVMGTASTPDTCEWYENKACAWLYPRADMPDHPQWVERSSGFLRILQAQDDISRVVVPEGCRATVNSHPSPNEKDNLKLVDNAGYGVHEVKNVNDGTLLVGWRGLGASSASCTCS